jgi:myosin heavy subunit
MALPKQVQKQSEEVQELYKELNGEVETQEPVSEVEANTNEAPVEEVVSDSESEQAPQSGTEEQGQPDTEPKDTWEQKYKTLQGMYNAEVPRMKAENRELSSRVTQMEQLLSTLNNQPVAQPESIDPLITDKDVQEYGDSIDVMRRAAREELAQSNARVTELENTIRQLQSSVVPQMNQISHAQAQTAEQAFWADLSGKVPQWQDINNDQNFQSWLLEIDPLTGISRQTYLEDAQSNLDSNRVAQFFMSWPGAKSTPVAQTNRKVPSEQLEKQVSPGRGRSGTNTMPSEGQTYSPADIEQFFDAVRKGKYRGREEERGRIERDIFAAQREGRIVTA